MPTTENITQEIARLNIRLPLHVKELNPKSRY